MMIGAPVVMRRIAGTMLVLPRRRYVRSAFQLAEAPSHALLQTMSPASLVLA